MSLGAPGAEKVDHLSDFRREVLADLKAHMGDHPSVKEFFESLDGEVIDDLTLSEKLGDLVDSDPLFFRWRTNLGQGSRVPVTLTQELDGKGIVPDSRQIEDIWRYKLIKDGAENVDLKEGIVASFREKIDLTLHCQGRSRAEVEQLIAGGDALLKASFTRYAALLANYFIYQKTKPIADKLKEASTEEAKLKKLFSDFPKDINSRKKLEAKIFEFITAPQAGVRSTVGTFEQEVVMLQEEVFKTRDQDSIDAVANTSRSKEVLNVMQRQHLLVQLAALFALLTVSVGAIVGVNVAMDALLTNGEVASEAEVDDIKAQIARLEKDIAAARDLMASLGPWLAEETGAEDKGEYYQAEIDKIVGDVFAFRDLSDPDLEKLKTELATLSVEARSYYDRSGAKKNEIVLVEGVYVEKTQSGNLKEIISTNYAKADELESKNPELAQLHTELAEDLSKLFKAMDEAEWLITGSNNLAGQAKILSEQYYRSVSAEVARRGSLPYTVTQVIGRADKHEDYLTQLGQLHAGGEAAVYEVRQNENGILEPVKIDVNQLLGAHEDGSARVTPDIEIQESGSVWEMSTGNQTFRTLIDERLRTALAKGGECYAVMRLKNGVYETYDQGCGGTPAHLQPTDLHFTVRNDQVLITQHAEGGTTNDYQFGMSDMEINTIVLKNDSRVMTAGNLYQVRPRN